MAKRNFAKLYRKKGFDNPAFRKMMRISIKNKKIRGIKLTKDDEIFLAKDQCRRKIQEINTKKNRELKKDKVTFTSIFNKSQQVGNTESARKPALSNDVLA